MPQTRDARTPPRLLAIAGSDSGGGAGIQADLKTFAAFQCYGMSVVTAITAQNTLGVQKVEGISPEMVSAQYQSVSDDIGVDAIKIGMLFGVDTIMALSKLFEGERHLPPIVLDPVCVATSGHSLLPLEAVDTLKKHLFPFADIITPNVPEAELLAGLLAGSIKTMDDMCDCARTLAHHRGPRWVYLKGGHLPIEREGGRKVVVDILWDSREEKEILTERPWLDVKNTHGTGCTLSSAIAAELARGKSVLEATRSAADYVAAAIATSYPLGGGSGPVNHAHMTLRRSLPLPSAYNLTPFLDYLRSYDPAAWKAYVEHPFPLGLAAGTMQLHKFLHFIKQDYHFLKQYARTNSLAAYKTNDMSLMRASTTIVDAVLKETEMHVAYCAKYGITREQLLSVPESVTNIAYTRYVLDVAAQGDYLDTLVVTSPCLVGYGEIGKRLMTATDGVDRSASNPYYGWIAEYGGDWYQGAVQTGVDLLERTVADSPISAQRLEECAKVFVQATKLEVGFFDEAMNAVADADAAAATR